ncbi:hypothetical protein [Segetibacter koreensis]|uniref:hypothetical protein n=1 Tax=Segetibacter koreensis TaxID=398037 RepID=UPI00035C6C0A|nr:hypothetical protein [Segetibacter koreensis]
MKENEFLLLEYLQSNSPKTFKELEDFFIGKFPNNREESLMIYLKNLEWSGLITDEQELIFINETGRRIFKEEKAKKNKIVYEKNLQIQKLEIDLVNAKRVYKTYWLTFTLAILSFAISLILLILKFKGL